MMITRDIIPKAHGKFRDVDPDVWTDLSVYIGQLEYEIASLQRQLESYKVVATSDTGKCSSVHSVLGKANATVLNEDVEAIAIVMVHSGLLENSVETGFHYNKNWLKLVGGVAVLQNHLLTMPEDE